MSRVKHIVTDLQDVHTELSEEDAELMQMFPRSRETVLDDMLFVRKGDRAYLVKKSAVSRVRKAISAFLWGWLRAGCIVFAVVTIGRWVNGESAASTLTAFLLFLIPFIAKVPWEVRYGA